MAFGSRITHKLLSPVVPEEPIRVVLAQHTTKDCAAVKFAPPPPAQRRHSLIIDLHGSIVRPDAPQWRITPINEMRMPKWVCSSFITSLQSYSSPEVLGL